MSMHQFISEWYGTAKTASAPQAEDLELQAQQMLFAKLAADNGIDFSKLSEEQVAHLWDQTFSTEKTAQEATETPAATPVSMSKEAQLLHFAKVVEDSGIELSKCSEADVASYWAQVFPSEKTAQKDPDPDHDGDKDKEKESGHGEEEKAEAAKKEHAEAKEAAVKLAEADYLGRVMAHSLVDQLQKIAAAEAGETPAEGEAKEAAMPPQLAAALHKGKDVAGKAGKSVADATKRGKELLTGSKMKAHIANERSAHPAVKHLHMDAAMDEARKVTKARMGAAGAGAAAAGAAAHHALKKKESSAIDQLAANEAVKLAAEGGWDPEEAVSRLSAVLTLGPTESEKIAHVPDLNSAVGIRALELLELAGYPVTWDNNSAA